jgi:hypothetical protein
MVQGVTLLAEARRSQASALTWSYCRGP